MLEKLTSISSELAIERDWVTQLAGAPPCPPCTQPVAARERSRGGGAPPARRASITATIRSVLQFLAWRPRMFSNPLHSPACPPPAGKSNVVALARSNAYLRRTDLFTELVGVGWCRQNLGNVAGGGWGCAGGRARARQSRSAPALFSGTRGCGRDVPLPLLCNPARAPQVGALAFGAIYSRGGLPASMAFTAGACCAWVPAAAAAATPAPRPGAAPV